MEQRDTEIMAINRPITNEDFEAFIVLPENKDRLLEFIDGEIREKLPTQVHAFIVVLLARFFGNYLHQNPIGWAFAEARYKLPNEKNSYVIDFSFALSTGRKMTAKGAAPYMPELAVEIQSPDDSQEELEAKKDYYLANGTQIVWLIYPKDQRVDVFISGEAKRELYKGDTLTGETLLPGLEISVSALFDFE